MSDDLPCEWLVTIRPDMQVPVTALRMDVEDGCLIFRDRSGWIVEAFSRNGWMSVR